MTQSNIFYLAELLEQILHFLAIDKSLYPILYVSQLCTYFMETYQAKMGK